MDTDIQNKNASCKHASCKIVIQFGSVGKRLSFWSLFGTASMYTLIQIKTSCLGNLTLNAYVLPLASCNAGVLCIADRGQGRMKGSQNLSVLWDRWVWTAGKSTKQKVQSVATPVFVYSTVGSTTSTSAVIFREIRKICTTWLRTSVHVNIASDNYSSKCHIWLHLFLNTNTFSKAHS